MIIFLIRHVNFPTWLRRCDQQGFLYLVFTNESNMVNKVEALYPLGASDHISLNISLVLYTESSINRPSFNYVNGDFVSLRSMIKDVNLTNRVQACDNINDMWDWFHKAIANLFVPVRGKSAANNKKQWMTKELKNHVKKKTKVWNTYLAAKSFSNWTFKKRIATV